MRELVVAKVVDETEDAYSIYLENSLETPYTYKPGQYLTIEVLIDGEAHRRAYSLSSSPHHNKLLQVTIKQLPGGLVSNYLYETLKPGNSLKVASPKGNFFIETDPTQCKHYIFIAGGSGITPIYSMIESILSEEQLSKVSLWYGNRNEESIIFKENILKLKRLYSDRFDLLISLSRPSAEWSGNRGRLDTERIYQLIMELFMVDVYKKAYFICGPEGMIAAAREAMEQHAIHPGDIYVEHFNVSPDQTEEPEETSAEEALLDLQDREITLILNEEKLKLVVKKDESILDAALAAGYNLSYACKSGICSSCMAKLNKGKVHMDLTAGLSEKELEDSYILTCQAHPLDSDVEIEAEEDEF